MEATKQLERTKRMREAVALPHLLLEEEWRAPHGWLGRYKAQPNGKHNTHPLNFVGFIVDDEESEQGKLQWYSHDMQETAAKQHLAFFVKFCSATKDE